MSRWAAPYRRASGAGGGGTDDGQILLLTLLFTILAFSLVVVVVDATAVHLARTQLLDAADAAALDAADGIDLAVTYRSGASPQDPDGAPLQHLALTDESVLAAVGTYVTGYEPPSGISDVTVSAGTGTDDGVSATVVLSARVQLPIAGAVVSDWRDGLTITVHSTATAPVTGRPAIGDS